MDLLLLQNCRNKRPRICVQHRRLDRRIHHTESMVGKHGFPSSHGLCYHLVVEQSGAVVAGALRNHRACTPVPARTGPSEPVIPDRRRQGALPGACLLHQGFQLFQNPFLFRSVPDYRRIRRLRHCDKQFPRTFAFRLLRRLHLRAAGRSRRLSPDAFGIRAQRHVRTGQQNDHRSAESPLAALCRIRSLERQIPLP